MPPSPAMRFSPGREQRAENHKRGRSLEGGLLFKEKDDDLALFNEMQTKERENFLLQSPDDFEDAFASKLKQFSDFKLGISIPVRGEGSELLNVEVEKNDYDWLLTPPDTPLFPSLDDEPPAVTVASRGRPRSQPITISRSSTMEKSYRSSRGSASPNRSSPSPRSGGSSFQPRGRPSSAPRSSPTPGPRLATPSRRPSTPPNKASTPAQRSSTPTPRRVSSGSGPRGTSPIRTSQGNSVSPKIRAWQSNIPGFSSEAPPNLRTSLADRPASYVRGSSPASRNGRDSSLKFGRQSMSPSASRSVSSSHSQDRELISSHSKGSIASSGDDDADSLQSIHVGSLDRLTSKRISAFPNNRAPTFSKKSTRIISPSSAPKRSFDTAPRQMDHRKSPQNMFRPLLSSVPSSTFYVGKASSAHRSLISRNSPVTTSSNTSSDQGTSVAPDNEGSDLHQEDMVIERGKVPYADVQEEVFAFEKVDVLNKDGGDDIDDPSLQFQLNELDRDRSIECEPGESGEFSHQDNDVEISSVSGAVCVRSKCSDVDGLENTKVCSVCGCRYRVTDTVEKDFNVCPHCISKDDIVASTTSDYKMEALENSPVFSVEISEGSKPSDKPDTGPLMPSSQSRSELIDKFETLVSQHADNIIEDGRISFHDQSHIDSKESFLPVSPVEEVELSILFQQRTGQATADHTSPDSETGSQQSQQSKPYPSLRVDASDGAGFALLLKRSSSSKGSVVQGRTFVASTINYDDFSYARESTNSLRSSIGHGSTSASSSVDFSSTRPVETRVQRQLSGKKSEMENYKHDMSTRSQSSGMSFSGASNHPHQALGHATNTSDEDIKVCVGRLKHDGTEMASESHGKVVASEEKQMDISDKSFTGTTIPEVELVEQNESCIKMDASMSDTLCSPVANRLEDKLIAASPNCRGFPSNENEEDLPTNTSSVSDLEADVDASAIPPEPNTGTENITLNVSLINKPDAVDVPINHLASISEIETENHCESIPGSENYDASMITKGIVTELQGPSVSVPSEKDVATLFLDHNASDNAYGILEESSVMVECRGGSKGRSLTLEEATDTILFCSSIVHDLAYQAASIAMEKENSVPLEGSQPTVMVLGKSTAERKDTCGRIPGRRSAKSQKVRQKRMERDVKSPPSKIENDENVDESMVRNVGLPEKMNGEKPPKLESKCNCTIM